MDVNIGKYTDYMARPKVSPEAFLSKKKILVVFPSLIMENKKETTDTLELSAALYK